MVAFGLRDLGDAVADFYEVVPELRGLHEAVLAVLLPEDVLDGGRIGGQRIRVVLGAILDDITTLTQPSLLHPLLLKLLNLIRNLALALKLRVELYHALGELYSRQPALRVDVHPGEEGIVEELPDVADPFPRVIFGQRVEVEVDPVREVKISGAALDDEGDQFLIGQVLFDHHEGNDLRDEVLQVVAVLRPVDDWVDALGGEQGVDAGGGGGVLVEVVEDLVDGLLVAVLDVLEFLGGR